MGEKYLSAAPCVDRRMAHLFLAGACLSMLNWPRDPSELNHSRLKVFFALLAP